MILWPTTAFKKDGELYENFRDRYPASLLDCLGKTIPTGPGSVILDLATGTGFLARSLPLGVKVIGLDIDFSMLTTARNASKRPALWVNASSPFLPIRIRSLDAIVMGNALHWLVGSLSAEILASYVKKAGSLILITRSQLLSGEERWKSRVKSFLSTIVPGTIASFANDIEPFAGKHIEFLGSARLPIISDQEFSGLFSPTVREYAGFLLSTSIFSPLRSSMSLDDLAVRLTPILEEYLIDGRIEERISYRFTVAKAESTKELS